MTYPKRAKGLVKSGRACFVDGETVQLACPPEQPIQKRQEDIIMDIEINNMELTEEKGDCIVTAEVVEEKEDVLEAEKMDMNGKITKNAKKLLDIGFSLKDIFHHLNAIRSDNGYVDQALANLEELPYTTPAAGTPDTSIAARAEAIANIVKYRETTNQMMIKFYTQLYTDYICELPTF